MVTCQDRPFSGRDFAWVSISLALLFLLTSGARAETEKTLYSFCSVLHCVDGSMPDGITLDSTSGNLFGVTYFGGNKNGCGHTPACNGVAYEFAPSTAAYTVLYKFCKQAGCTDGKNPNRVKLVVDTAGNLYGTTEYGGSSSNGGVVFELSPALNLWKEKVLYTFCSRLHCKDGSDVRAGLTYAGESSGQPYDGESPLYGTTFVGGANQSGTVFAVSPKIGSKKWSEQVLYSFCAQTSCNDGSSPNADLAIDRNGNLFGTTTSGGQFAGGTVFELIANAGTYTESVLYSLCAAINCTDGEGPWSGVTLDQSGNLFGTARDGGSSNDGVLFELTPIESQWQYSVLLNFDGANGADPIGALALDGAGGVYGTTAGLTSGASATVFDFNGVLNTLYTFCNQKGCPDGKAPMSNLVTDEAGNLFGTAQNGARRDSGTLFELSP